MFRSSPLYIISFQSGGKSDVKKKGRKEENVCRVYLFLFSFLSWSGSGTSRKVVSALSSRADVTSRLIAVSMCFLWSLFVLTVSVHKISSFYLSPPAPNSSLHNPSHVWRNCFPLATLILLFFFFLTSDRKGACSRCVATHLYIFMWQPTSQQPVGSFIVYS